MESIGCSYIAGIGAYLPEKIVRSDDIFAAAKPERFGVPVDFISRHIGIKERRVADTGVQPSDLATLASKLALKDSGVSPAQIDLIIFAGISRDCEEPATAHFVQTALGAKNAYCMDITNACLGFMAAWFAANAYIASKSAKNVLICTGENPNKFLPQAIDMISRAETKKNFKDQLGFLTVGDGGAAFVLTRPPEQSRGLRWIKFLSKGALAPLCYYNKVGFGIDGAMHMSTISRELIRFNEEIIDETMDRLEWFPEQIDKVYMHQVGRKPHELLAALAKVPIEKAPSTYSQFGNLTSSTIPVSMYLNPPERGQRVLILGAGSGLSVCQGGMIY